MFEKECGIEGKCSYHNKDWVSLMPLPNCSYCFSSYNGRYPSKTTVWYSVWINEFFSSKVVLSKVVKRVLLVCLARPTSVKVLSLEDVLVARLLALVVHPRVISLATCSNCVMRGQHLEILCYSSPVPCMPLLFCFRYVGIINKFE